MRVIHVALKEHYGVQGGILDGILADCPLDGENPQWKRPAVVVVPGGGYAMCSKREGEPIASFFLSRGFQAFILTYQTCQDGVHYPEQLLEAASAVDYIRSHAQEFYVNPDEVFVVGFSAGGHLTADLAVEYAFASEKMGRQLNCRPTAVGLSYPVISRQTGYVDSHNNLLAGCTEEELTAHSHRLDLDQQVDENTPPAFIWSTAEDSVVPSANALRFALALATHGVPYELHVYPQGEHGLSTCDLEICAPERYLQKNGAWLENCASFFRLYTQEPF